MDSSDRIVLLLVKVLQRYAFFLKPPNFAIVFCLETFG